MKYLHHHRFHLHSDVNLTNGSTLRVCQSEIFASIQCLIFFIVKFWYNFGSPKGVFPQHFYPGKFFLFNNQR